MDISVVVPLYNEEESLPELFAWIERVMNANGFSYEVIFVNDGSTDRSWQVIEQLQAQAPDKVRGIKFRRNYGKSPALFCGFEQAQGDVVITMDADLQDSPDEIPELYRMITQNGYDLVSGWKQKRFRKRNASDIDDFEKTNAYIKRHIQDYVLPGNANKIIELQSLSIELKEKFNALVSEHNAFLIRKAAAVQYTKVIRQYLHKQKTEETKEQSRDRTYNRQKDKQTLE